MSSLRTSDAESRAPFHDRSRAFLRYVAANAGNPLETMWGAYRHFDVYALALLALDDHDADAHRLLGETLDMIDRNFADERADPGYKWHLADFAMHPLMRAYLRYRDAHFPGDPVWERLAATARGFLFHYGDLSENHNFLHLTLRYLVGQEWPDAVLVDGRTGAEHRTEVVPLIRKWMRDWAMRGTAEWGADIYYNVNLLSLLNLYDFAGDPALRQAAQDVLDLMALDEALDAFAGSYVGAARRSYSVYRMDVRQSPARPLHHLWFDPHAGGRTLSGANNPFNLHFIGGVIQAATSDYIPPEPVRWIARDRSPAQNRATHLVGVWEGSTVDHLAKQTLRLPEVMQSTMISPGCGERYTEHVWQVTMSEEALVFANHPTLSTASDPATRAERTRNTLQRFAEAAPAPRPGGDAPGQSGNEANGYWYWNTGNVPPGHPGDVRPGYWQGNTAGPRSFGTDSLAFLIYDIPEDDLLPWAHVYLPRHAFDEVREEQQWVFLRRGEGYCALWLPGGYTATTDGFWAGTELKLTGRRCALLSFIGHAARDGGFDAFIGHARDLRPQWDAEGLTLSAEAPGDGGRIAVSYAGGASRDGVPIETRGARFETPWGTMPAGSPVLQLNTPAGEYKLDLSGWID